MVKLYYNLIKHGNWTLDRVPEKWRIEVEKMLNA